MKEREYLDDCQDRAWAMSAKQSVWTSERNFVSSRNFSHEEPFFRLSSSVIALTKSFLSLEQVGCFDNLSGILAWYGLTGNITLREKKSLDNKFTNEFK
jgi:hypothetical protein